MDIKALPKASPVALPELDEYLTPFAALFRRSLTRQSVERYITGLLTDLSRKTCDTIAAAVAGTSTERLQHLLTDADWDPVAVDKVRVQRVWCEKSMHSTNCHNNIHQVDSPIGLFVK